MARENPGWGYTRLLGAMKLLGHKIGRNTITRILEDAGVELAFITDPKVLVKILDHTRALVPDLAPRAGCGAREVNGGGDVQLEG